MMRMKHDHNTQTLLVRFSGRMLRSGYAPSPLKTRHWQKLYYRSWVQSLSVYFYKKEKKPQIVFSSKDENKSFCCVYEWKDKKRTIFLRKRSRGSLISSLVTPRSDTSITCNEKQVKIKEKMDWSGKWWVWTRHTVSSSSDAIPVHR